MLCAPPRLRARPGPGLARLAAALVLGALAGVAHAGDHRDTPVLEAEAGLDIADVFAWTGPSAVPPAVGDVDAGSVDAGDTPGAPYVYLAMTLRGRPVPGAQYVLHLDSRAELTGAGVETYALCTFDQGLAVECWLGDDAYVVGDATGGLEGYDLKVWTGFTDDPTFADLDKVRGLRGALAAAGTSTAAACPGLPAGEPRRLLAELSAGGADSFAGRSVFVILLRAPAAVAAPGGDLLGVWASTRSAR